MDFTFFMAVKELQLEAIRIQNDFDLTDEQMKKRYPILFELLNGLRK